MSLIVETGSGLTDAESYASLVDAADYFAKRGNEVWADLDESAKEANLRKATDYIEQKYAEAFKGTRESLSQALSWPREGVYVDGWLLPSNKVPEAVKRACIELAMRAASGELSIDVQAQVTEETIGPITTKYAPGARQNKRYTAAENLLAPYLSGGAHTCRLVRA